MNNFSFVHRQIHSPISEEVLAEVSAVLGASVGLEARNQTSMKRKRTATTRKFLISNEQPKTLNKVKFNKKNKSNNFCAKKRIRKTKRIAT